jgi:hypothetical protein
VLALLLKLENSKYGLKLDLPGNYDLFWAKIRKDLVNFSVIYGSLASRKVNLELL